MTADETFCLYCQREYGTAAKLKTHVLNKHPNTYRAAVYRIGSEKQPDTKEHR